MQNRKISSPYEGQVDNKALDDFLHQHGALKKRLLPSDLTLMMSSLSTKKELERAQGVADVAKKVADDFKAAIGEKQKTIDSLEKQVGAVGRYRQFRFLRDLRWSVRLLCIIFNRDEATLYYPVSLHPSVGR